MSVLSGSFLIFFIVLLILYWCIPSKWRWIVLLAGSYLFYASANRKWLLLIVFTTLQTYFAARWLGKLNHYIKEDLKKIEDKEQRKKKKEAIIRQKKGIVALSLVTNFAVLFFFKTSYLWKEVPLLLPLGISFYTFQTIGYLIDVYRANFEPERNLFKYALFASYFPQIIQGPINRYDKLFPQFFAERKFEWRRIKMGFWLFLWGMFKKLVISDRAAVFVSAALGEGMPDTPGSIIVLGIFLFNLQLYTDFSGGIDMVSGISQMLGIELAENFRRPFFSKTLGEYWRRWHISLGAWIKDYVFYPIAMSKLFAKLGKNAKKVFGNHIGKTLPAAVTSVITFVLIGLWHDITWCYVLYGLWHGILTALSNLCEPVIARINHELEIRTDVLSFRWFQRLRTWMIVSVGESFTLAGTLGMTAIMYGRIFKSFKARALLLDIAGFGLDIPNLFVLLCATLLLIFISMKQESGVRIREALEKQNVWFQWLMALGILWVTAVFGVYGPGYDAAAFIYGGF
ncbi:MAG: MBOAT family protein [Lachnospiraceae bacterium]|nr:MBOAT family protein [Lachnospiraceae bacterium]